MERARAAASAVIAEAVPVTVQVGAIALEGELAMPAAAVGIVLFAHGSGSSRHSPRNRFVAQVLRTAGLGTLLLDLLTPGEEAGDMQTARLRFDIELLGERLVRATEWLVSAPETADTPLGCFGASTGAAAALRAAAECPDRIAAVVSRGGRPDLAGSALSRVRAPTLLIVGGDDTQVLGMNHVALRQLAAVEKQLIVIPGATHLFEESGALEAVARLAAGWFTRHLDVAAGRMHAGHAGYRSGR
jgi:putative phosphoribosyl transferase